jgi:hypothetical protein
MRAPEGDCVIEKLEVTFQVNFKVAFRDANFQNIVFVVCILSWLVKSLYRLWRGGPVYSLNMSMWWQIEMANAGLICGR